MKNRELFTLCALGLALLVSFASAYAQDSDKDNLRPYKQLNPIRGNATAQPTVSPSISVIDTKHDRFLYPINPSTAPNGVVAIRRAGADDVRRMNHATN